MRNPARLAADLSGRPLLLRESALPGLARMLGLETSERSSGLAGFFGRARALFAARDAAEAPRTEPMAYAPRWLGEPDACGFGWTLKDGVGCLLIDSVLMAEGFGWGDSWYHGYDTLLAAYEEMVADARVKAIFEISDSPGGVVDAGLPELAAFKRAHRQAAGGKPIWTFARNAFSAAYWIPSSSDRILAARESGVGSIGAVVGWCGLAGALEQEGIEYRAFKFGKRKTDGSPFEPLSDTAAESLQAEIDQCGRWFVADVIAGRPNLTEEAVLATEAACYFADADDPERSGLALGLVDQIATERDAFAAIRELAAGIGDGADPLPPAASAAPAAVKETDMKRSAVMAAAKKAGLSRDQIRKLSAELPDEDEPETEEDEDEPAASEDDDDPAAEGDEDDDDPAAEGDEDEEAEDDDEEIDAKTARAIVRLPEAKGREGLAQQLAFTPGMTRGRARRLLAAAPKASAARGQLASTLADSPRLGPDAAGGKAAPRAGAAATYARNRAAALGKK